MRLLRLLFQRARSLFRGAKVDAELENELSFHLEQLTKENIASGMDARQAHLAARRALGGVALIEEQCRDQRRIGWLTDLQKDVAYAWRMMRKSPGFTALSAVTLAIGVGASIADYTLAESLLLRSLPYPEPQRLVSLSDVHVRHGRSGVGQANFGDWQTSNTVFERMAITEFSQANLTHLGEPERIVGRSVSEGFFEMLGVQPQLGRWFTPDERQPGGDRVVMLSHSLWMRKLGGRPEAVGATIVIDDQPYRVTGVMPATFRFNEGSVSEYWTLIRYRNHDRKQHQYAAYARLRPGVTIEAAQTQMREIARRLERAYPDNAGWGVQVKSMRILLRSAEAGAALLVFAVAALIVLLVGCGNVASLLMARGVGRSKEIAVRIAMGASRPRVIRLLLTESLLLAALGTLGGVALAAWLLRLFVAMTPPWLGLGAMIEVTPTLVAFVVAVALATAALTGLWPALRGSRSNLQDELKESGGSLVAGRRHQRALSALVVGEVSLAVVLLTFAGLLARSMVTLLHSDLGFRTDHLLTFRMAVPNSRYRADQDRIRFWDTLLPRLSAVPGVVSATAAFGIPLSGQNSCDGVEIEGAAAARDWTDTMTCIRIVAPDYFRTMGIPLRQGSTFTAADTAAASPAIVNETFARRLLRDPNPLGKRVRFARGKWHTIVGVAGDSHYGGVGDPAEYEMYVPYTEDPWLEFVALRTAVPEAGILSAVRQTVRGVDADIPITEVRTMRESVDLDTSLNRQVTTVIAAFGAITLGMATVGLAGVMAYAVSRRRREFGLRMALGARRGDIFRSVIRNAGRLVAAGCVLGAVIAYLSANVLASLLYGVRPHDPAALAGAPLLLGAVGLLACLAPARRAASIEPMAALRQE